MKWLGLLILALGVYWLWPKPVRYPQVYLRESPIQENLTKKLSWDIDGHHLTALASYKIKALVLGAERYRNDRFAKICPLDLALGWGPMSDYRELSEMEIWQSGRWYNYRWRETANVMPLEKVQANSANTHVIPMNPAIRKKLFQIKAGDVIEAEGYLVQVNGEEPGAVWKSSLSRTDTDGGACEIMLVEKVEIERLPPANPIARH